MDNTENENENTDDTGRKDNLNDGFVQEKTELGK